jgi:DNA-binding CsgD family transcriptional regulator
MFGRDPDRVRIERLLAGVVDGPVGIAIEGAPGIGKTTLWRDTLSAARRRGWQVLSTAPSERDRDLAFAGLADLFDDLPTAVTAALPDPQARALATALSIDDGPAVNQQTLPRSALAVLRKLAQARPLVVAVDDEQWLDRPTARVLAFALSRLREEPVCLLLSRRPHDDAASLFSQVAQRYGRAGVTTLRLEPLDLASIESMVAARLGGSLSGRVLEQVHETSGGNPLYALAIARTIEPHGGATRELTIPRTLTDAISRRLDILDARAADALLVVAAAAAPTPALLHAVVDDFALDHLDSALDAELIEADGDQLRFTHPLLASTHYACSPAGRRRQLHRRLSAVVVDQVERAQHLALGAEVPDRDVAAQLGQAADVAARRGAPEAAADLLEHAIRLTPLDDVAQRWSRALAAVEQRHASGEFARSEGVLEPILRSGVSGTIRAQALRLLSQVRSADDFVSQGPLLEEALDHARDDPEVRSRIEMDLAVWANNRGDFTAAVRWTRAAVSSAETARNDRLLASALGLQADAEVLAGAGIRRDLLDRALAIGRPDEGPVYDTPRCGYGRALFWSDCLDEARPLLEEALRYAREEGHEPDRLGIAWLLAFLEWHAGNPAAAEEHRRATDDAVEIASDDGLFWNLWVDSWLAAGRGELERARALAEEGMASVQRSGGQSGEIPMAMVLGVVDLWTGNAAAAHERLEAVRERAVEGGWGLMGAMALGLWSTDIEALIALDRLDEAEALLDDLVARVHASENPHAVAVAYRSRGLLLAARHDVGAAIDALDAAMAAHALRPLPAEMGRTLLEKGTLQRRAKRKSAAKQSLEQALAILEPLGAAPWVARARDELGRIGLRRATPTDGPTPAQRRVAELLATGASNREIAGALHMSPRSVESHLTSLYRQFEVRSRAQLVAKLATGASISSVDDGSAAP